MKGKVRQDRFRLVGEQEPQRRVLRQAGGRLGDHGHQHVLESRFISGPGGNAGEEPCRFSRDHRVPQRIASTREEPVHRRPAASRLAGDVVEGGLGQAPSGDTAHGRPDDALGRAVGPVDNPANRSPSEGALRQGQHGHRLRR